MTVLQTLSAAADAQRVQAAAPQHQSSQLEELWVPVLQIHGALKK
jgi:hypothetical protein